METSEAVSKIERMIYLYDVNLKKIVDATLQYQKCMFDVLESCGKDMNEVKNIRDLLQERKRRSDDDFELDCKKQKLDEDVIIDVL